MILGMQLLLFRSREGWEKRGAEDSKEVKDDRWRGVRKKGRLRVWMLERTR